MLQRSGCQDCVWLLRPDVGQPPLIVPAVDCYDVARLGGAGTAKDRDPAEVYPILPALPEARCLDGRGDDSGLVERKVRQVGAPRRQAGVSLDGSEASKLPLDEGRSRVLLCSGVGVQSAVVVPDQARIVPGEGRKRKATVLERLFAAVDLTADALESDIPGQGIHTIIWDGLWSDVDVPRGVYDLLFLPLGTVLLPVDGVAVVADLTAGGEAVDEVCGIADYFDLGVILQVGPCLEDGPDTRLLI